MEQIQMALMQGPIQQINEFSSQKLSNIAQNYRNSKIDLKSQNCQNLQFQDRLHLNLQIDKLLIQIQQCKVIIAQVIQTYLPFSNNQIDIKTIQLSNLKNQNQFFFEKIPQNRNSFKNNKQINVQQIEKTQQILKHQDSYQINGLTNKQNQQLDLESSRPYKQEKQFGQIAHKLQKQQQGHKIGQQLVNQLKQNNNLTQKLVQIQCEQKQDNQILNQIQKQLSNFKKTLMLRQSQLGMLIFILDNKHNKQFIQTYQDIYSPIKKYIIPIDKLNSKFNVFILQEVFQIQFEFLKQYLNVIKQIQERLLKYQFSKNQEINVKKTMLQTFTTESVHSKLQKALKSTLKLKIINSKIITMAEIYPYACIKDLSDLFSCSKTHQRWLRLIQNDIIKFKIYGQPQKIRQTFTALKNNLNIINASMNILNQSKDLSVFNYKNWSQIYNSTSKILKVALFKSDALHQASVMISQPDGKLAKQIWNLTQQKTLKGFVAAVLPAIEFSQKIFIPRILNNYILKKEYSQLPSEIYIERRTTYGNQLYQQASYEKKIKCRINAKYRINRIYETKTKNQQDLQRQKEKKQPGYSKLFFNTLNTMTKTISSINSYFKKQGQNSTTAILHIHGGGFISMSSFIHQTYTRKWANQLQVPILSVDYGKAPEYPFPNGLYDCLQAYIWLRFVFRQIYQVQVNRVIIVGDSAGGNLAAALTTLLIQWGLPKPDGLVLVYPALNLNYNNYTPSLLCALNDLILPHTFLKICLNAYIKDPEIDAQNNPFISPINSDNQVLKQYPKTKIFVGGKDPFHDDCCRFVQKLNDCKQGNAELTIFDQFPHGFLQFDLSTYPHQPSRKATKQVENALRELIQEKI